MSKRRGLCLHIFELFVADPRGGQNTDLHRFHRNIYPAEEIVFVSIAVVAQKDASDWGRKEHRSWISRLRDMGSGTTTLETCGGLRTSHSFDVERVSGRGGHVM